MSTQDEQGYDGGYAVMPRSIQRDPTISWKAKLAYLALSSRANKFGHCWPSQQTIAEECGYSADTAKRALAELKARGFISWTKATNELLIADGIAPEKAKLSHGREPNFYTLGSPAPSHGAVSTTSGGPEHHVVVPSAPLTKQVNEAIEEKNARPTNGARRISAPGARKKPRALSSVGGPPSPAEAWGQGGPQQF